MQLLGVRNAKTIKGEKLGWLTGILYMAPHTLGHRGNVCANSTEQCRALCLFSAGRGVMAPVYESRIKKTQWFFDSPHSFMDALVEDCEAIIRKANRENLKPCVRPNGTQDIPWERLPVNREGVRYANLFTAFPEIQFYDYTKRPDRMWKYVDGYMPENYHLTFSLTEDNDQDAISFLRRGANVAAILKEPREAMAVVGGPYGPPARLTPCNNFGHIEKFLTFDGDQHDLRFLDPEGVVVMLSPKGKAKLPEFEGGMVR